MDIAIISMSALASTDVSHNDAHRIEGISINNECCASYHTCTAACEHVRCSVCCLTSKDKYIITAATVSLHASVSHNIAPVSAA
jgi:hypothetical protein